MNLDPEVTPSSSSSTSNPRQLPKVRKTLRWSSFATLCLIQLVLGGWSTLLFLLAVVNKLERNSFGVNPSILLALCGLICLIISIYNSFRYGKLAGKFTLPDKVLSKFTSKKIIKTVILSSLVGVAITFLGSTIIAGVMFSKLFILDTGLYNQYKNTDYITSTDMFVCQACINTMAAHCAGLVPLRGSQESKVKSQESKVKSIELSGFDNL